LLVTVAATAAVDQLSLERSNVESDRAAKQRIEGLERDRGDMSGVQSLERREVRGDGSADPDALEISIQSKLARHFSAPPYLLVTAVVASVVVAKRLPDR
jgi:hypothetical protein